MSDASVAELRKMLRASRKPIGKMSRDEVAKELERHAPAPIVKEEVKPAKEPKAPKALAAAEKTEVVKAKAPAKAAKSVKPAANVETAPATKKAGLIKGSQEARDHMKRLRDARTAKKESVA